MPGARDSFTATEIKAGVLVVTSVLILVGFVAIIRGCMRSDEGMQVYYATFSDVGGLDEGADVRFGGVRVGRVEEIRIGADGRTQIRVTALVPAKVPVNAASIASIDQISLTAELHLEISSGEPGAPLLTDGASLPSTGVAGGLFDIPDVDGLIARIEGLLDDVGVLLGVEREQARAAATDDEVVGLAQLASVLATALRETTSTVRGVRSLVEDEPGGAREVMARLVELEEIASALMQEMRAAVAENREPLRQSMANVAELTDNAADTINKLSEGLESTMVHLQDAGANTSDLLDDQRPAIEEILLNLRQTTRNLRELSRTLANDPSALIRGARPQGRTSGEER